LHQLRYPTVARILEFPREIRILERVKEVSSDVSLFRYITNVAVAIPLFAITLRLFGMCCHRPTRLYGSQVFPYVQSYTLGVVAIAWMAKEYQEYRTGGHNVSISLAIILLFLYGAATKLWKKGSTLRSTPRQLSSLSASSRSSMHRFLGSMLPTSTITTSTQETSSKLYSTEPCFLSLGLIQQLSVQDMHALFVWTQTFETPTKGSRYLHSTLDGILDASPQSPITPVAALLAVVRIFAEWRHLHMPQAYPRYRLAMGAARRDLLHNVGQCEVGIDCKSWKEALQSQNQPRLPQLIEPSIANGFLWMVRQLRYQMRLLDCALHGTDACQAYRQTYEPYHGFWTRQVFQASLDVAPPMEVLLTSLLRNSVVEAPVVVQEEQDDETWVQLDIDESKHDESDDQPHPLLHEWNRFERFLGQCTGQELNTSSTSNLHSSRNLLSRPKSSSSHSMQQPKATCDTQPIQDWVHFMDPYLTQLEDLIEDLNMNDPTKV